jgi:hypothetical protein
MNRIKFAGAAAAIAVLSATGIAATARADDGKVTVVRTDVSTQAKPVVDRDELRIKELHDRLQITPAQENLWTKVAQLMRRNDDRIDALTEARNGKAPTMTAVEDLRSYGEITEAHATGIKNFVPAFESLYESMSAAQKANADDVFRNTGRKGQKKM